MRTQTATEDAINIIVSFVRNVALGRAMYASGVYPHLNFWRVLQGNTMDMAAIEWCKLFGNDDKTTQPSHWKNIVPTTGHDKFRLELFDTLGLNKRQWNEYRTSIVEYRNTMAAHLDEPEKRPLYFPVFDKALLASSVYYNYIMSEATMRVDYRYYPDDLLRYEEDFRIQSQGIAKAAMASTANIRESVR